MPKLTKAALLLAAVAATLTTTVAQTFNVFPVDHVWSYMATPSDTTFCLDGTGWEASGYDDSPWPTGPGGFTGGENTAATLTSLAGLLNTTSLPPPSLSSGRPQYFRTHFNLASTNGLSLILSNRIDDQAIFFVNGTRVADYRHPTSQTDNCTPAGAGGDEATVWVVITLTPAQLANIIQTGDNVLAVSVHQNSAASGDMVFVSILSGTTGAPPPPSVGPIGFTNGTGVITFDTAPPVQQWSTIVGTGTHSDFDLAATMAQMDAAAKTNDATIITNALTSLTGNPPIFQNAAVYASDAGAQYIQTCPVGNSYTRVMATLTNLTGSTVNSIGIRYDLTVRSAVAEQFPGHLVYYSTTGTPGSWVQIPELSDATNDNINGTYAKSACISLTTPWTSYSKMYFLWCDDNANPASPDTRLDIDNVQFITLYQGPPMFANATDPVSRTNAQCSATTFSAQFLGCTPAPTYQWYKTDVTHPIAGATSSSYTIANVQPSDAGVYFVRASNGGIPDESHHATLTVTPAPAFAVVSVVGPIVGVSLGTLVSALDQILISFNAPISIVNNPGSAFTVAPRGGGIAMNWSATVTNGTNVLLITDPRTPGVNYDVTITDPVTNTCTGASITGTFQVASGKLLVDIDANQQWRYNDSGVDPGATWANVGFNDSAWPQGLAVLDAKRGQDRTTNSTGISNTIVRTELTLTNAIYTSNATQFDIPTYDFRTHVSLTSIPQSLQAITFFDDGGAIFINGTPALRRRDDATNVFGGYSGNPYAINPASDAIYEGPFDLPTENLVVGDNVIAVEIRQADATSSDVTMGLQLIGLYSTLPQKLTITPSGGNVIITWPSGILQESTTLPSFTDTLGSPTSPYTVSASGAKKFYRLR